MILDGIISIIGNFINVILSPLSIVGGGINFLLGIDMVFDFLTFICYIVPWYNLMPLVFIVCLSVSVRITVAIYKLIPFI